MLLNTTCMFLLMNIMGATAAREPSCPACSRYDYEERVLERVLRNELVIETMLKEIRETNVKVESALKLMHEDRHKLDATLKSLEKSKEEMDTEIKGTLHVSLKNMSDSLAFIERLQQDMGTNLNNGIKTAMFNISNAVAEMTQNATKTGLQLKKDFEILKDQLTIPSIYFDANTPADYSLDSGQVVVYTQVRVNEGKCYNPATGIFTVSIPGLYVFTVHYLVFSSTAAGLAIIHQGTQIQPSYFAPGSGNWASTSMQVYIRANKADQIWVESTHSSTHLHGDSNYNSFSGALIHM